MTRVGKVTSLRKSVNKQTLVEISFVGGDYLVLTTNDKYNIDDELEVEISITPVGK